MMFRIIMVMWSIFTRDIVRYLVFYVIRINQITVLVGYETFAYIMHWQPRHQTYNTEIVINDQ